MTRFFAAVSYAPGSPPAYADLRDLFTADGRLIRNTRDPVTWTIEEFVTAREGAWREGPASFAEWELSETTELFGNVAHRFSPYGKRADDVEVSGAISTQLVRTADGWRIASMAWDDE